MRDYDEATIRGMRQILNDRERAKNGCAKPEDLRPYRPTPEQENRNAKRASNAYFIVMHTPAFYEAGVRLPPLTWRQRIKNWIGRMLGA